MNEGSDNDDMSQSTADQSRIENPHPKEAIEHEGKNDFESARSISDQTSTFKGDDEQDEQEDDFRPRRSEVEDAYERDAEILVDTQPNLTSNTDAVITPAAATASSMADGVVKKKGFCVPVSNPNAKSSQQQPLSSSVTAVSEKMKHRNPGYVKQVSTKASSSSASASSASASHHTNRSRGGDSSSDDDNHDRGQTKRSRDGHSKSKESSHHKHRDKHGNTRGHNDAKSNAEKPKKDKNAPKGASSSYIFFANKVRSGNPPYTHILQTLSIHTVLLI